MSVVVGVPTCAAMFEERIVYRTSARYADALRDGSDAHALLIPPMGEAQLAVLDRIDGLLVPGSTSNVHPSHYGEDQSATPDLHDLARDATTLPLIRAAAARGMPVLAICRGVQELNVALGGTLHQNIHELPGRQDHGADNLCPSEADFGPRHIVSLTGCLARIVGRSEIVVNSLHSQAINRLAPGLSVEAIAEDGTIEAVSGTAGFLLGVQWHPEWRLRDYPASVAIFRAFGDACRAWRFSAGARSGRRLTSPPGGPAGRVSRPFLSVPVRTGDGLPCFPAVGASADDRRSAHAANVRMSARTGWRDALRSLAAEIETGFASLGQMCPKAAFATADDEPGHARPAGVFSA